jgi:hypothetical protein
LTNLDLPPRYVARVGAETHLRGYQTFAKTGRQFGFATEPDELSGLSPVEAMYKVGWTKAQIKGHVGRTIAVVVLDTTVPVPGADGASTRMEVGSVRWPDLKRACLDSPRFVDAAARRGLSRADIEDLFEIAARSPVKGAPATSDPERADQLAELYLLLEREGVNELVTGIGHTMQEDGHLGAREVMVRPNGTGYRLTPDNHRIHTLGVLTRSDFDEFFAEVKE